jgi:exopolyphosphatase/guanosine-5'-triphosphate,3'-diphosphate pyrophosphatase
MRVSVVDAGSKTVRLVVADAEGGVLLPVHTAKWKLRLTDHVEPDGSLSERALARLVAAIAAAGETARRWRAAGPLAFATAVVRDAPNRDHVMRAVREQTGMRMCSLPGNMEAELTFLAVRRWMGWRAGSLALLDLGGGSLEVAFGRGRLPGFAASLPLGAHRLTKEFFDTEDPPTGAQLKALRRRVRHRRHISHLPAAGPSVRGLSRTPRAVRPAPHAPPGPAQGPHHPRHTARGRT